MFSRFAVYFDEVVRSGSIRRASERLHLSPSAIDRHMLLMEQRLGVRLFERLPQGLHLTAAGEVLIAYVRRWRREQRQAMAQIDDLIGLRRGEVTLAIAEGAIDFVARAMPPFREKYPGIDIKFVVAGAQAVGESVLEGSVEIALTFNPPDGLDFRVERTMVYQLGAVVPPGHPLADREEIAFADCAKHRLVLPDETLSYRHIVDKVWAKTIGGHTRGGVYANSIGLLKALIQSGLGVGLLTKLDVTAEIADGQLIFIPLAEPKIPLSVLSLISASGRTLSAPASLLLNHLAQVMRESGVGGAG
ncbi:MAG: LysR family transcriptional regulator [Novosphingobium sp.]